MRYFILAAFLIVPLIEIAVFIQVGGWIGLWPTIAMVILTAVLGTALLRRQGLATLNRARAALERGEMPLAEVFEGFCLLIAGALLLTPGFVTDIAGGLLFVPIVRRLLRRVLGARFVAHGSFEAHRRAGGGRATGDTIDGEYEEIEMRPEPLPPRDHDEDRHDR